MSVIRKILTAPWVIFLALGGLAYAIYPNSVEKPLIHISASQFASYLQANLQPYRIEPNPAIEQRLLDQLIGEQALLQRALSMNYQYLPVVQDRLKKLGSFLEEGSGVQPEDKVLIQRAVDLGLLESDPVIRRYLVSVMERALVSAVAISISEQDIASYYEQHVDEFVQPPRLDITHVFFGVDNGRSREDARAARQRILALGESSELDQILEQGDVFYSGHQFAGKNQTQLANIFGADFARGVFLSEAGQWSQPLQSAYGWHLVWPENLRPPVTPPLAQVRDKILARIQRDREKQVLEQQLARLKQQYQIIVDIDGQTEAAS